MKCLICNSETSFFFSKNFNSSTSFDRLFDLGVVEYSKCQNCGFVCSQTHAEMEDKKWVELNFKFHSYVENPNNILPGHQPPYLMQAALIKVLQKNNIISENCLDWGGGYGTLANILSKYYGVSMAVYDKYVQNNSPSHGIKYVELKNISNHKYDTVVNSAVFEHVTKREHLDEINSFVSASGCLILHTVVCEDIPKDSNWFYLMPVHCAFHTNDSMRHLMKQWGYLFSLYCPVAKSWVLLKKNSFDIENEIQKINVEFQFQYLYCKSGFMDYWK